MNDNLSYEFIQKQYIKNPEDCDYNRDYISNENIDYGKKMHRLYNIIRGKEQRTVMMQAMHIQYADKILKNAYNKDSDEQLNYNVLDEQQREKVDEFCLMYDTSIAICLNLYESFMAIQKHIATLFTDDKLHSVLKYISTKSEAAIIRYKLLSNHNSNSSGAISLIESIIRSTNKLCANKSNNVESDLNEITITLLKIIEISKMLYRDDVNINDSQTSEYKGGYCILLHLKKNMVSFQRKENL